MGRRVYGLGHRRERDDTAYVMSFDRSGHTAMRDENGIRLATALCSAA